jgi:hypothetical protein
LRSWSAVSSGPGVPSSGIELGVAELDFVDHALTQCCSVPRHDRGGSTKPSDVAGTRRCPTPPRST